MQPTDEGNASRLTTLSFRAFLNQELARRCAANPQYSLRTFAMYLEIDHATLSQVLRGKRAVTERLIRRLGPLLKLSADEVTAFAQYEAFAAAPGNAEAVVAERLVTDAAALISDPVCFDLLALLQTEAFRPDSRWVGAALGCSTDEVNIALTRLIRLGLMEMSAHGQWLDRTGLAQLTRPAFTHLVIRRLVERLGDP
jgi:transcriptional regulator with XRE-family HTH domain